MKSQILRKALWAVDLALVVVLLLLGARVFGSPAAREVAETGGAAGVEAPPSDLAEPLTDQEVLSILRSGRIVPAPVVAAVRQAPVVAPPEETDITANFRYRLVGTATGATPECAFFVDSTTKQQVAKTVGDDLADAKLVGIWEDRVMIQKGGRTGYLYPEKKADLAALAPPVPARPAYPSVLPRPAVAPQPAPAVESTSEDETDGDEFGEDPDQFIMSEKQFRTYLENAGTYINQVSTQSHVGPDKEIDGLLLTNVPETSEAYKRGFRKGDIITTVQGEPVIDTTSALKVAWDVLKNEEYILDVGIIRNGQEDALTFENLAGVALLLVAQHRGIREVGVPEVGLGLSAGDRSRGQREIESLALHLPQDRYQFPERRVELDARGEHRIVGRLEGYRLAGVYSLGRRRRRSSRSRRGS